ncbi:MAG TPA: PP2C family serine/threonine-protein phosphatase, partial [Clostridia bacterium]|nr:PP2C family serine/threonine-protein phosphatase [Clostridia bacterium]
MIKNGWSSVRQSIRFCALACTICICYGTIVIAVIDKDTLTVTALGDSPAFLISGGQIKRLAKNKLKYEDMIEQGYITRAEY